MKTTKRIVFHEITKPAIQKAITQPRTVDINLVNAQQARRVLDRLVGFELSSILWRKVKGKLSAGRVQSVAVKLVAEREREIMAFQTSSFYKVSATFDVKNEQGRMVKLKADLPARYDSEQDAHAFLKKCIGASFTIKNIEIKPLKRKPTAPFTTSTLQQEASRKLGFGVQRTMSNAQRLYEQGFITYMRTDSTNLSETAIASIADEIVKSYGQQYLHTRRFKSKNEMAQEAHEAIRPSYIERQQVSSDRDEQRLYELIWKRTIASQMSEAELEKTIVDISISTQPKEVLKAEGEVLKFDGFLKVYLESSDDDEDEDSDTKGMLPPLTVGQVLNLDELIGLERFTRPPSRYTEAGLVKKMEELGIGRPSTYAPTISKIMEPGRGYVTKESREGEPRNFQLISLKNNTITKKTETENTGAFSNRLVSSDLGMIVVDFLSEHFESIMDYSFTADIEKRFDHIAEGGEEWTQMMERFYNPFHKQVEKTLEEADRANGERILGKDPETGRTVLIRMTRLGRPVAQIGAPDELEGDEKPRYGNLRPGQSMETLTFAEAMELFKLPKDLGEYEGQPVSVAVGRFGPYVKWGEAYISLPKGTEPLEVDLKQALQLIAEKKIADAPAGTYKGIPYTLGKGRFGPFIKYNEMFINIPRRYDPDNLSQTEAEELINSKIDKEANRYIQKWEAEKIILENGRWGPFIRFGKLSINLPKINDQRVTSEQAAEYTLEQVKAIIEAEHPDAFAKQKAAAKKKAATAKTKTTATKAVAKAKPKKAKS
jgi:DNA topoisomerase I